MKVRIKTIKGWVNNSDFLFSENTTSDVFNKNFDKFSKEYLEPNGFKPLIRSFDTLRWKNATEKIIIKGWYWKGSWSDPKKQTVAVFYK